MKKKEIGRLDRFAFALGSVTLMTPLLAIPIIPGDRINAAWDERLAARESGTDYALGQSPIGCAT